MRPAPYDLLMWALLSGLGAVGLTIILRNAPVVRGWVRDGRKPWACNVCMPLYTAAALLSVAIWWAGDWSYAVAYPGAYAVGYMALDRITRPPAGPPPELPMDTDD